MPSKRTLPLSLAAAVLIALPLAAWSFVKPLRVAAPTLLSGVQCPRSEICTDDLSALPQAQLLYQAGYERAAAAVGRFRQAPRVVFCHTQACAEHFGLGQRAAEAVGNIGMVVAPRGWQTFYVAHELIHFRQAEMLGNLAVASKPRWLIEGMAYALSDDPRHPLGQPFEQWRTRFQSWYSDVGPQHMWDAARAVD